LEADKSESVKMGNYEEADMSKNKIEELKKALIVAKKKELYTQHQNELESLDFSYKSEIKGFNSEWDNKFRDLEEKSKILEEQLNEKHLKEMEDLYNFLEQKLPKIVKYSKKYLDLKNQEDNLVKLQR